MSAIREGRFDALMAHDASCVQQAGPDIFRFEPRIATENCLGCIAGCQHPEHMFDS